MSQQVLIDYKNIACQCETICAIAEQRLKEIDELLADIEKESTRLLNEQTESLKASIVKEKDGLLAQIGKVRAKASEDAKMGMVETNNHDERYAHREDAINAAKRLEDMVNELSSQKIIEFRSLLENLLKDSLRANYQRLLAKAKGQISIDEKARELLDSIQDDVLRQFTYLAYIQNDSLAAEELLKSGKELMQSSLNSTYESRIAEEENRIRKELEESRVDKKIIEGISSEKVGSAKERLAQMQQEATAEIIGEKVRRQSLKVIMKAIADRGFIVDKKNIKIDREANEVHMVAMKASGERADFKIYMDGKFIYDFHHGYQGQACQKDIGPFMKDLEEVYGIHITKSQEIWSNPDKISTTKYQAMNSNKNKG